MTIWRSALASVAVLALAGGASPGGVSAVHVASGAPTRVVGATSPSMTSYAVASPTCASLASSLTLTQQVGQLLMLGMPSAGLSARNAHVLATTRAGAVILLGNSRAGAAANRTYLARVRAAGRGPRQVGLMVAADQEGGLVQRLRGTGFARIPAARQQAGLSDATLTRRATTWARQLRAAGVHANLAPVADVVPTSLEHVNEPIGKLKRGYGPHPTVVARKDAAFVRGMHAGGVASAVKHFPGLGRVRGNTDYQAHVVDRVTTRHDVTLQGFAAGVRAGVDMVMISSAFYSLIDAHHRAAYSSVVIDGMVRHDLHYQGVVISDDLATRALRGVRPGRRAFFFLRSGGDLVIAGDPSQASTMTREVLAEAKRSPTFRRSVTVKVTRVLRMKARRGLTSCR